MHALVLSLSLLTGTILSNCRFLKKAALLLCSSSITTKKITHLFISILGSMHKNATTFAWYFPPLFLKYNTILNAIFFFFKM